MPGAAILAARAALRTGSGLVTCAIPAAIAAAVGAATPEAIQAHLDGPPASEKLRTLLVRADALAAGPGLGLSPLASTLVQVIVRHAGAPCVVDADALNAIALEPVRAGPPRADRVWTPHPGEFERLTGERPATEAERIAAASRFAGRFGGVVVLKGHRTVIAGGGEVHVNSTGNPGMATAGAGDVLTGIIVSLLGQRLSPMEAAVLGVYLHGLAGDIAAAARGEASVIASDIIDCLPEAIRRHQGRP
jgi:NAD(P)H-hydrate epimerase